MPARVARIPRSTRKPVRLSAPRKSVRVVPGGFPVLPIALVVAIALLGWFLYPMARIRYIEQRKVERLQSQLAQVQERNRKLKAQVEKLKTAEGVEEAAHELGLARPGEQVWVTVEGGKAGSTPATALPVRTAAATSDTVTRVLDLVFGVGP